MADKRPYKITGPQGQPVTFYGADGLPLPSAEQLDQAGASAVTNIDQAAPASQGQYPVVVDAPQQMAPNPIGRALNISGAPVPPPVQLKSDTAVDPSALAEDRVPLAPGGANQDRSASRGNADAVIADAQARDRARSSAGAPAGPPKDANGLAVTSQKFEYEAPVPLSEEQSKERTRIGAQMDANNLAMDQMAKGQIIANFMREGNAIAAAAEAQKNQMEAQQLEEARLAQKQARLNELRTRADQLEAEAKSAKEPTSSDHWSRGGGKGVLGTLLAGLNVFMSAMGGKYMRSNGGKNVWSDSMDKQVNEYVADQRREYERGQGRAREAKNDYAKQLAIWGDPDDAAQALKVQKLNLLSAHARQMAEIPSNQERTNRAQQAMLMIDQMGLQAKQQLINNGTQKIMEERTVPRPVYTGGGGNALKQAAEDAKNRDIIRASFEKEYGRLPTDVEIDMKSKQIVRLSNRLFGGISTYTNPDGVKDVRAVQQAADTIFDKTDMLEQAMGKGDEVRYRETLAELQSVYAGITTDAKDLMGLGALTGDDFKLVREQVGEAKRLKFNEMKSKLDVFKRIVADKARASARGTYLDLARNQAYDPPKGK